MIIEKISCSFKKNYKNNKFSKIISKNLFLNLLNVKDINSAITKILESNIKPGQYVLKTIKNLKFLILFISLM